MTSITAKIPENRLDHAASGQQLSCRCSCRVHRIARYVIVITDRAVTPVKSAQRYVLVKSGLRLSLANTSMLSLKNDIFPRIYDSPASLSAHASTGMVGEVLIEGGAAFTALVVEDEVLIAFNMLDCLNDLGAVDVVVTHDVASALLHLSERKFDVAVVDWILGKQTSDAIVQAMNDAGRKAVIATGVHAQAVPEALRLQNTIISKPFQIETFNAAVWESLGR